jgi:hypothetical protein
MRKLKMKNKKLLIICIGIAILFGCVYYFLYKSAYLYKTNVELTFFDKDCNFESALFIITNSNDRDLIGKIVLPTFSKEDQYLYEKIYRNDSFYKDSAIIISANGYLSFFPNAESWYGCTGSYKIRIDSIYEVRFVRRPSRESN